MLKIDFTLVTQPSTWENIGYLRFLSQVFSPRKLNCLLTSRFYPSWSFKEGRCPGSNASSFPNSTFFASTSIIDLNGRSFTISCWIKLTKRNEGSEPIYGDWIKPWQFLLGTKNQSIIFSRHKLNDANEEWWSLESSEIPLHSWTHVVVTWQHLAGQVTIYADGNKIAYRTYSPDGTFFPPSGFPYRIGIDWKGHQFQGSVMDLYVFGTSLSLDEINRLRGERFEISYAFACWNFMIPGKSMGPSYKTGLSRRQVESQDYNPKFKTDYV